MNRPAVHPPRRPERRPPGWFALTLIVAVAGCGTLAGLERRAVYHPGRGSTPPEPPEPARTLVTETEDGLRLHGWLVEAIGGPDSAGDRRLVLFFHGNAGDRSSRLGEAETFASAGCDTLLTDYRGYGGNRGTPSEEGLRRDARAWWRAAVAEGYRPESIAVVGNSLGGAVAVGLAAEMCDAGAPPGGLIVRSTFDSLTETAAHHQPLLPVHWLMNDRFDSAALARRVTCSVLQTHGTDDRVVPIARGERLHAAFPEADADGAPKRWIAVEGAGHNDLRRRAGTAWSEPERTFLNGLRVR